MNFIMIRGMEWNGRMKWNGAGRMEGMEWNEEWMEWKEDLKDVII